MSDRIETRTLGALAGIYRPGGGRKAPEDIELDLPIQVVHAVDRETELAAGAFFEWDASITALAGASNRGSLARNGFFALWQNELQQLGIRPDNADIWVTDVAANLDGTDDNISIAMAGLVQAGFAQTVGQPYALSIVNSTFGVPILAGGDEPMRYLDGVGGIYPGTSWSDVGMPVRMGRGNSSLRVYVAATGAGSCTVHWRFMLWIGPKDTRPPLAA